MKSYTYIAKLYIHRGLSYGCLMFFLIRQVEILHIGQFCKTFESNSLSNYFVEKVWCILPKLFCMLLSRQQFIRLYDRYFIQYLIFSASRTCQIKEARLFWTTGIIFIKLISLSYIPSITMFWTNFSQSNRRFFYWSNFL